MANRKYVAELENGVWLAPWDGDPGRTKDIKNAKWFTYKANAQKALLKAKKDYPQRKYKHGCVRLVNVDARIDSCTIQSVVFSEERAEVCDCGHHHYFWTFKRGNVCMNCGKPKSQT